MLTELDYGVQAVIQALQVRSMWENTLLVFVSDNGGPLDHSTNAPLRGGKHTFWEGGVRVEAFLAGGMLPSSLRNTTWGGIAHASDWYLTLTEGVAGVPVDPEHTGGPRPLDGFNLWPAILAQGTSPRTEVVHQVNNTYFDEGVSSIRIGDMKLIRGAVGDNRIIGWPARSEVHVPIGKSGAVIEPGTDHVRGTTITVNVHHACSPYCLFNVTADLSESNDLAPQQQYAALAQEMSERLDAHGRTGPPNAYIWPDRNKLNQITQSLCPRLLETGSVQPVDW
jgi:arylsulfatase A-like enzyme